MKVVFLDFNGVIDTWDNFDEINPENLARLKRILDETGAKVVISSSSKTSYFFTGHFNSVFIKIAKGLVEAGIEVIDITPLARGKEAEINMYLKEHPEIENFCVLDDDYEMPSLKDYVVKLPPQSKEYPNGLEDEHVLKAISILNKTQKTSHVLKKSLPKNFDKRS